VPFEIRTRQHWLKQQSCNPKKKKDQYCANSMIFQRIMSFRFLKKNQNQRTVSFGHFKKIRIKEPAIQVFQNPQRTVGFHERFTGFYAVFFSFKVLPRDDNRKRTGVAAQHW
jgi:hypothetical protein